jgi:dihydroneopterin triphosphate diphosphatase
VTSKIPVSVLVVIHTKDLQVLLLERADHPGFWQSVTGSLQTVDESLAAACLREVHEETGWLADASSLDDWHLQHCFKIYGHWRHRYEAGITHNTEHVFGLLAPRRFTPTLDSREHVRYRWLGWRDAADACFSWTNALAIRRLGERLRGA